MTDEERTGFLTGGSYDSLGIKPSGEEFPKQSTWRDSEHPHRDVATIIHEWIETVRMFRPTGRAPASITIPNMMIAWFVQQRKNTGLTVERHKETGQVVFNGVQLIPEESTEMPTQTITDDPYGPSPLAGQIVKILIWMELMRDLGLLEHILNSDPEGK